MRTLLQISELDDGRLDFYGAPYSEIEQYPASLDRYMHELKRAPWTAQFWIGLFGAAQQLKELGMSFFAPEPDNDSDYYDEDDYFPDWDENCWQTSQTESVSESPSTQESYLERQKKTTAVFACLAEWRQETADRKGIHDWDVVKHSVLSSIARKIPLSREELMDVRGVGNLTWDRYGEEILTVVQAALASLEEPDSAPVEEGSPGAGPLEVPCPAPP